MQRIAETVSPGVNYLFSGDEDVLFTAMQELIDRLALRDLVQVIVGGNRISFDHLPLILGDRAGDVYEILDNISVSRAETCYQMRDVLSSLKPSQIPLVITDMLSPFTERDLTIQEVTIVLEDCIEFVHKFSETAPVLISSKHYPERPYLFSLLEQHCSMRMYFQAPRAKRAPNTQIQMGIY